MKQVIITIDTEGHAGKDPIKHLIWGETPSGELGGIPLLMDIFDEYDAKGLFFVDFAEAFDYGEDRIADIVNYIIQRGHEVGVHIHPDHMTNSKKLFLFDYSYEEQYDIIEKCTKVYKDITGRAPEAFRAGKYGADYITLDILAKLGYKADFSQFFKYTKWCHIDPPVTGNETIKLDNGLIEVPVMTYHHFFPGLFDRYDKFDTDSSRQEHNYLFNRLLNEPDIHTIVMFAHSFSLLNWRQDVNNPNINKRAVSNLRHALSIVKDNKKAEFVDLKSILSLPMRRASETNKSVFDVSGFPALYFCLNKARQVLQYRYYSKRYGETL